MHCRAFPFPLALFAVGATVAVAAGPKPATTLADAIDYFRDVSGVNLVVDWKALEAAGVSRDAAIELKLTKVSLRTALRKTLDAAAPGKLTYYVDGNVVHVTTVEVADAVLVTRVYAVGDLLVDIPDFEGPDFNLQSSRGNGGGRSGGGSGGGSSGGGASLFGNAVATARDKGGTRAERAAALIELIQTTIRPDVWTVNGGRATLRYLNGNLIVTAPPSVQAMID